MAERSLVLDGTRFRCVVRESARRRTVGLELLDPTTICVRVPTGWRGAVAPLIREHADWILKQAARLAQRANERPVLQMGGWGYVLGVRQPIVALPGTGSVIAIPAEQEAREAVRHWYQQHARDVLAARLAWWSDRLGIEYQAYKLSNATRRWGYCRADGIIGLNWRLLQAPVWVVDYVVVHELTHRQYPHHQALFWQAVRSAYPRADEARRWLAEYGSTLMW